MKFGKILAIVAVAATCAMADVYGGFTAGLGAQAWTASYSGGSSTLADQDGPAIHFGFDVGFPLKKDDAGKVAIGFGGNFWAQQLDAYGLDDTGLLMMWGPSINAKVGKLVAGVRIGTSFVIKPNTATAAPWALASTPTSATNSSPTGPSSSTRTTRPPNTTMTSTGTSAASA